MGILLTMSLMNVSLDLRHPPLVQNFTMTPADILIPKVTIKCDPDFVQLHPLIGWISSDITRRPLSILQSPYCYNAQNGMQVAQPCTQCVSTSRRCSV
jgi:hypothetical protein